MFVGSVGLDKQFLLSISYKFDRFIRKGDNLFNCRCPICGDSKKDAKKARGYFYVTTTNPHLRFSCKNCGVNMAFSTLLQHVDPSLHSQYKIERYKLLGYVPHTVNNKDVDNNMVNMMKNSRKPIIKERLSDRFPFMTPVVDLPKNHDAVLYLDNRKIPSRYYSLFHYVNKTRFLNAVSDKYEGRFKTNAPRVVLPFYNRSGTLIGVTARDLTGHEKSKYVTCRLDEKESMIFGVDRLDLDKPIIVVEGPIDSLFLPNTIAASTSDLDGVIKTIGNLDTTLVFDNQPRNDEICKIIRKAIGKGHKVFIWPKDIHEKDINDLIVAGYTENEIVSLIHENTYSGLRADLEFGEWRKYNA